jgi:hypothetical protein
MVESGGYSKLSHSSALRRYISLPITFDQSAQLVLGSGGDRWDHKRLLMQVDKAIKIFEEAHSGCIALFVFDQLSTHASLGDDALRAFDMNRSNGGAQRKQRDTVIPINNPYPKFCGKA